MATKFRRNGKWYIKHKDVDGVWKNISCGHNVTSADAEAIRKTYDAKELNSLHKAPIRLVEMTVIEALKKYRDVVLPSEEKASSSIKREQAELNNFIEYFENQKIISFESVTNDGIIAYMTFSQADRLFDEDASGRAKNAPEILQLDVEKQFLLY